MGNESSVSVGDKLADALSLKFSSGSEKMSAQESQQKRLKVCGEILETEKTYLDQLSTMVGAYDKVMQLQRIGSELDRKTLFQDIETLHGLHLDFYKKLEARVSPSLKKSGYYTLLVGDLFSEFSAMLPMYSAFIDSFEERSRCLDRIIQKNAKAFKVLEDDVKSKGLNNGLHNLLITPVQRLPRYLLLLNSLRECTLDDHKDYQLLKTACTKLQALCEQINQRKRESENRERLIALQEQCSDVLVLPHRKLLMQFNVKIVSTKSRHNQGVLILCSDGLLLLKHKTASRKMQIGCLCKKIEQQDEQVVLIGDKKKYSVTMEDDERNKLVEEMKKVFP